MTTPTTPVAIVDDDTLQAVQSLWNGTAGQAAGLPAAFTEPPTAGDTKTPTAATYAIIECKLERRELFGVLGPWSDRRRVTITVYGRKADVVAGAGAILNVFNRNLGAPGTTAATGNPYPTLTYPSGSGFMSWLPEGEAKLEKLKGAEATARGQDQWKATVEAVVWSKRAI